MDEATQRLLQRLLSALEGVDGWLDPIEAWQLHEEVRALPPGPVTVVEIGSFKGRSAIALASAIRVRGGGGRVFAIDPQIDPDNSQEFRRNVGARGLTDLVEPVLAMSHDARPSFEAGTVQLLFVDGAHEYPAVRRDLDDWESTLSPGGVVAVNDLFLGSVARLLIERMARRGSPFRAPRYVHNTLFATYRPGATWSRDDTLAAWRLGLFLRAGRAWLRASERIDARERIPKRSRELAARLSGRVLWELGPKPGGRRQAGGTMVTVERMARSRAAG